MTAKYGLHRLSADAQCHSIEDAQRAVETMLSMLDRLLPLLSAQKAELVYDLDLELRSLQGDGGHFWGLINSLRHDQKTRWTFYRNNPARRISGGELLVTVTCHPESDTRKEDLISPELLDGYESWLSFAGSDVFDCPHLQIRPVDFPVVLMRNFSSVASLINEWPRYEASPKHRLQEYIQGNEYISPMDLSDEDAQAALLLSIEWGASRFVMMRSKIYRFVRTNPGGVQPVFHGFKLRPKDVPVEVQRMLGDVAG